MYFQWLHLGDLCLYLYLSVFLHQQSVCGELTLTSASKTCICPEDVVTYKCTIMGQYGGSTLFRGNPSSFVGCAAGGYSHQEQEIVLHHSQFTFMSPGPKVTCNNGKIVGQSLSLENGIYTSQLNITVTSGLIGNTIECIHDNGTENMTVLVGNSRINNTALVSPIKLHLNKIDFKSSQFTFNWNSMASDCPAISYNIQASNCGHCPTATNHTTVTCTDIPTEGICMFSVETMVCGGIPTNQNDVLNITLSNNSAMLEKDLLIALISTGIILFLIIISFFCYILITRRKRSRSYGSNSMQMPNTYSTSDEMKSTSYEDVMKVFDNQSMGTYGPIEYEEPIKTKCLNNNTRTTDQPIDLDHLLIYLQDQLNSQWYLYGLAIGVPKEFLENLKEHSKKDCLTEVLDYWLSNHHGQPTWSEVVEAQKKVNFFNSAKKFIATV